MSFTNSTDRISDRSGLRKMILYNLFNKLMHTIIFLEKHIKSPNRSKIVPCRYVLTKFILTRDKY